MHPVNHTQGTRRAHSPIAAAIVVALALVPLAPIGCSESKPPAPTAIAPTAGDRSYTTRGRITQLPLAGDARLGLRIAHEEIADFLSKDGKVVGMKAHDMGFPWLAPGVSLDGFAVDDVVEITFDVRFNAPERHTLTAITKLPGDTPLRL
jgi:hypothetical protein